MAKRNNECKKPCLAVALRATPWPAVHGPENLLDGVRHIANKPRET
jgi:hypothetical protein